MSGNIFGRILTAIQARREVEEERIRTELLKELNISREDLQEDRFRVETFSFRMGDTSETVSVKVWKLVGHREAEIKASISFHERELLPVENKETPGK